MGHRELGDGERCRPGEPESALGWAIIAMRDITERLGKVRASDHAQAFAVIGEAVWWVTIVDATLVRYYPDELTSSTLAGLPGRAAAADRGYVRRPAVRAEPDGLLRRPRDFIQAEA